MPSPVKMFRRKGRTVFPPWLPRGVSAGLVVLAAAIVLWLLFFAGHTRNVRIQGWLIPQQGLEKVFAPQPGVVTDLHVIKGSEVREGAPLFVLSIEDEGTVLGAARAEIAAVGAELAEADARRQLVVRAPKSGTVTEIHVERGGRANPSAPALSIVPAGSKLEAHLFSPGRHIRWLSPGQRVSLRYLDYPYQSFGHSEGVVTHVSRSPLNPGELPPQLFDLTGLVGSGEPIYRIRVSLPGQTITAYGNQVLLSFGMQVAAGVPVERSLIEWLVDPLPTLDREW